MQNNKKLLRTLGIVFFYTGILVGVVLFILMNWANFEAFFYFGYSAPADKALTTLRCPLLMTTTDKSAVTISITNNTDRDLAPLIRTDFSYSDMVISKSDNYPIAAGETRRLSWTVSSDNMSFGHLVLLRVYVHSVFTLPSRASTCGTVMVKVPGLTGIQLFVIMLTFSLACMAAGWGLWLTGSRPIQTDELIATRAMSIFTAIVLLGILAGFIDWWGLGMICAVASVLLTISVAGYYIQKT